MIWIVLTFVSIVTLVLAAAWFYLERPPCFRQRVIVNLRHDPDVAYDGVLWESRGTWIVLKQVRALRSDGKISAVDGDAVFQRSAILFLQVPPGERS